MSNTADHDRHDTWPVGQSNEVQGGFADKPSQPVPDQTDTDEATEVAEGATGTKQHRAQVDQRTDDQNGGNG